MTEAIASRRDGIGCAPHVHHDLAVRVAIFEGLGELEGKSRLANAPDATQADDVLAAGKLSPATLVSSSSRPVKSEGGSWDEGKYRGFLRVLGY